MLFGLQAATSSMWPCNPVFMIKSQVTVYLKAHKVQWAFENKANGERTKGDLTRTKKKKNGLVAEGGSRRVSGILGWMEESLKSWNTTVGLPESRSHKANNLESRWFFSLQIDSYRIWSWPFHPVKQHLAAVQGKIKNKKQQEKIHTLIFVNIAGGRVKLNGKIMKWMKFIEGAKNKR